MICETKESTPVLRKPPQNVGNVCLEAIAMMGRLADKLASLNSTLFLDEPLGERYLVEIKGPRGFQFVEGPMTAQEAAAYCLEFTQAAKGCGSYATRRNIRGMMAPRLRERKGPAITQDHPAVFREPEDVQPQVFLRKALDLWRDGHELSAVIMARVTLERYLHARCVRHPLINDAAMPQNVTAYRKHLMGVGSIDRKTSRRIDAVIHVASQAAHGRPVTFTRMAYVIQTTRTIVEQWQLPRREPVAV